MNLRPRTGKIAALPEGIRAELNQRLANGEQEPQILPWLNDLPEVRQLMAQRFEGKPILQQNLSLWRRGGFKDWQFAREHAADTRQLMGFMMEQAKADGVDVLQTAAAAASVHLMHVFSDLTEVLRSKAGEIKNEKLKMKNREGGEVKGEKLKVKSGEVAEAASSSWPSPPVGEREVERRVASSEDCLHGPVPVASSREGAEGIPDAVEHGVHADLPGGGERPAVPPAGRRYSRVEPCATTEAKRAPSQDEEEREHYSLMDRTVLICRAVSGIGVLGRLRQGETRLQLQQQRLAQTGELVKIRREEKDLKVSNHEESVGGKKARARRASGRPRGGGLSDEAFAQLNEAVKFM